MSIKITRQEVYGVIILLAVGFIGRYIGTTVSLHRNIVPVYKSELTSTCSSMTAGSLVSSKTEITKSVDSSLQNIYTNNSKSKKFYTLSGSDVVESGNTCYVEVHILPTMSGRLHFLSGNTVVKSDPINKQSVAN